MPIDLRVTAKSMGPLPYVPDNGCWGLMIMSWKIEAAATRKEKTNSDRLASFDPSTVPIVFESQIDLRE